MSSQTTTLQHIPENDFKLVKTELFDADVMDAIVNDRSGQFSTTLQSRLRQYNKSRKQGNTKEVVYHYGKDWADLKMGRLYAKDGLQAYPFDMRNPLLEKHYWDVDMENAHPRIASALGKRWGVNTDALDTYIHNRDAELAKVSPDRSVAKTAFLKALYGGNIKEYNEFYNDYDVPEGGDATLLKRIEVEVKNLTDMCWAKHEHLQKRATKVATAKSKQLKRPVNPRSTLLATVLQTEEKDCLMALDTYLQTQGRGIDIYIHDGGEVRKAENELEFPTELLRGGEKAIKEATGYDHTLVVKPFKHAFKLPERKSLGTLIDDGYAARIFIDLMGANIQRDGDTVWYFNTDTGLWSDTDAQFFANVCKFRKELVFTDGDTTYNYGGVVARINAMKTLILPQLTDTNFLKEKADSSVGKLLWRNGIYDFYTDTFTEGFDPNIVFKARINRNFPTSVDEGLVKRVDDILFVSAFNEGDGRDAGQYLKKALTMGIIGDYKRKKFYYGLGDANCGKGVLTASMTGAFGDYVCEWDANNLKYKAGTTTDEAKQRAWVLSLDGKRLAFSNELRMDKVLIDGNLLKNLSSGGDKVPARKNFKDEAPFINRATMFLMANDLIACQPEDSGTKERRRVIRYRIRFVDEPTEADERKKDPTLKDWFQTEAVANATFEVLRRCFQSLPVAERTVGGAFAEPPCVLEETKAWSGNGTGNFKEVFEEEYEITNDPTDWVLCADILKCMKRKGLAMSDQLIGRSISKLMSLPDGVAGSQERNKKKVRVGVRVRQEECAMTDEPQSVASTVSVKTEASAPPVGIMNAFKVSIPKNVREARPEMPPPIGACAKAGCDNNNGGDGNAFCGAHR